MILRHIRISPAGLPGTLWLPHSPKGLVALVHGSGSDRFNSRNSALAAALSQQGFATLLLDLLTIHEERLRWNILDIGLLAIRLSGVIDWTAGQPNLAKLPLGVFATGTAAAAALVAAKRRPIQAIVSYAGRPDLAHEILDDVHVPVLLLVPESHGPLTTDNQLACRRLKDPKAIRIIPWAGQPWNEADAITGIAVLAVDWFNHHLHPSTITTAKPPDHLGQASSPRPQPQQVRPGVRLGRDHECLRQIRRRENDR
ncbi:hypothetical protein FFK22_027290 [Mycobacterium sp. KBS0706]|uniref:dienelactone hydrolase family protein n=1 Tax=Mycobacterium sp. KBS0706 TaxID=2578109 RepID=UPI00110FC0FE|nr:hypothetical protein [Mycobacterium sp. KBS0706]TSD85470.1 hypothetical protein FFK22_027290 [Mycobacterium sp. KBS0706]